MVAARDPGRQVPGGLSRLGGVLGQVRGDRLPGDRVVGSGADGSDVGSLAGVAPSDGPTARLLGVRGRDEGSVPDRLRDRVREDEHRRPVRRRDHPLVVVRVEPVEPDQRVIVHDAAPLVLRDLPEREPHPAAVGAGVPGQAAVDGDGCAPPQLGGVARSRRLGRRGRSSRRTAVDRASARRRCGCGGRSGRGRAGRPRGASGRQGRAPAAGCRRRWECTSPNEGR